MVQKSNKPLVSVVLINWNSHKMARESISNIMKTAAYPNYEIYVVDNGSKDGSVEKISEEFPSVKIIKNAENKGFAYALNQGYRDSKGAYVGQVNVDCTMLDGWLGEMVKVLESSPEIGIVGAREVSREQANNAAELAKIRDEPNIEKMTLPVCWLVKREIIDKIGYLDAEFFSPAYGEEADWNFRARKIGYKVVKVNRANTIHEGSAVIKKAVGDKRYFVLINYHRLRSMLFNLSAIDLLRFVPGLGLIVFNSIFNGTFFLVLKSYWLNIKDWKLIMRQRREKRLFVPFKEPKFTVIQ